MNWKTADPESYRLMLAELKRQTLGLEMIPSENYVMPPVREAMGSILTNKYSEGYPRKRYYGGNDVIDQIELLAIERAKSLFGVPYVNVQPYSGSPANFAVHLATLAPGDTFMGLNLPDGGHITHGLSVSAGGIFHKAVPYHVLPNGRVDLDEVARLARVHKPKLIWCGATAYVYQIEYERFAQIADEIGAYLVADIAHVAGLIVAGVHPSPVDHAHLLTTTTHKTLRGPRGAMIMVTQKGLDKDPDLPAKVDKAVFPGLQGGPHDHQTAAIAIALKLAARKDFKDYGAQIVSNAKKLAESLKAEGLSLVGGGTENHLLLVNLVPILGAGGGIFAQEALETAGITVNKNTIPAEPSSSFYPSGIRLGTPALTTRGMKQEQMSQIGKWIAEAIDEVKHFRMPVDKQTRAQYLSEAKQSIRANSNLKKLAKTIAQFCRDFPLP